MKLSSQAITRVVKYVLTLIVIFLSLTSFSQTDAQVQSELAKNHISNMTDVQAALAKRGMTEADARRMANMYGINYDEYVAKYITHTASVAPGDTTGDSATATKIKFVTPADTTKITTHDVVTPTPKEKGLSYFGYSIFKNNPFGDEHYLVGNIDPGYIVGPGDRLRIYIWGSNTYQAEATIDLNGNIYLDGNGVFFAAGNTFASLKKKLTNYLGRFYSGLITKPQTSFIDVSLTQLRPVNITVLGESNAPGPHLINGFATVLNSLYASGGVKTSGSLRNIMVYRDNKLIKTVDLYDFITKGKLDNDLRLMDNDIVFIPKRLSTIKLTGEVRTPGIYELKPTEGINELLDFASGLLPDASIKNVEIKRIKPFESRGTNEIYDKYITSINLAELQKKNEDYRLFDGDEITIDTILSKVDNTVKISGSVNRPGTYPLNQFPTLKKLIIQAADSLLPRTYLEKVDIFKEDESGKRYFKTFNLNDVLQGAVKVGLERNDSVVVYNYDSLKNQDFVTVEGFVKRPRTMIWRQGLTMYDVIFASTNLEELQYRSEILTNRVDLKRFDYKTGQFKIETFNLDSIISDKTNVELLPKDQVILYSKNINQILNPKVSIKGYVKKPGVYDLSDNMTVEDLILQAGGFQQFADQTTAIVNRQSFNVNTGELSKDYFIKVNQAYLTGKIKRPAEGAFYLHPNDVVSIRLMSGYESPKSISITGEVAYPGVITLNNKAERLQSILSRVGGLTPFADLSTSFIRRDSVVFIMDLKNALKKNIAFLKDGDQIVIGSKTGTVRVNGAVENSGLFVWERGKRVNYYINASGNKTKDAGSVTVTYPNGLTYRKSFLSNPRVIPNSRIYVNFKPKKAKNPNRDFMDSFIKVLSVLTGTLTTVILAQRL